MDLIPLVFGSDRSEEDFFRMYLALMTRYLSDIQYVVNQTRDYQSALHFCDNLDAYNVRFYDEGRLSREQYQTFHCSIAGFRLDMYDSLDYWEDFIQYFDSLYESTDQTTLYIHPDEDLDRYRRFITSKDGPFTYMHWLYKYHRRYELIQKKLTTLRITGKAGNLKHKRQSELTEDEVRERFNRAMRMIQLWRGT